jgi:hypothetical protein
MIMMIIIMMDDDDVDDDDDEKDDDDDDDDDDDNLSPVITAGLKAGLDWTRLAIFSGMGGLYIGPVVHWWFGFLDWLSRRPAWDKT